MGYCQYSEDEPKRFLGEGREHTRPHPIRERTARLFPSPKGMENRTSPGPQEREKKSEELSQGDNEKNPFVFG